MGSVVYIHLLSLGWVQTPEARLDKGLFSAAKTDFTHLIRHKRKTHTFQMLALLAEDKIALFGLGNYKMKLNLLS